MDLGVYVFAKNEENLIVPCVSALQKVFPQVEVIDLGSEDSTLEKLASLKCKVRNVSCTPEEYPHLKNLVGKEHAWTFFVDGDEIYPEGELKKIPDLVNSRLFRAYRIGWLYVRNQKNIKQIATCVVPSGPKLYRSDRFTYRRAWPREVLGHRKKERIQSDIGIWCWHGKLLDRSTIVDPLRELKRQNYNIEEYHEKMDWINIKDWPWNTSR